LIPITIQTNKLTLPSTCTTQGSVPLLCTTVLQVVPLPFQGSSIRSDMNSLSYGSNNSNYASGISNYQISAIVPPTQHINTTLVERKFTIMEYNFMQLPITIKT